MVALGASAASAKDDNPHSARPFTIAVIGDMPYTAQQQAAFQGFINAMSADTSFHLLIHVGDIKSGSSACTDAYIGSIRDALNSYSGALVYTPGDNEWTDCHRNSGDPRNPVERLNFLRTQFFPDAGLTLGLAPRQVFTQAGDEDFPAFVENQAWVQSNDRPVSITAIYARVNEPGEECRVDNKAAPLGVIGSSGFGREDFLKGFALRREAHHILADGHQHVAKPDKLSAVADRSMTGDDYGLVRHAFQRGIHQANHAINTAAGGVVDKGIVAEPYEH